MYHKQQSIEVLALLRFFKAHVHIAGRSAWQSTWWYPSCLWKNGCAWGCLLSKHKYQCSGCKFIIYLSYITYIFKILKASIPPCGICWFSGPAWSFEPSSSGRLASCFKTSVDSGAAPQLKSSSLVVDGLSMDHISATRSIPTALCKGKVNLITADLGQTLAL